MGLWLDSAYPLNKPETDPGIKRGDCPGGIESTPTYLRQTYPNGYVTFKNAAVGEIGSATDFNPKPHHRHQHHQLKAVIQITIKIVFLMDILLTGRLVTRYGYQMALKRIV